MKRSNRKDALVQLVSTKVLSTAGADAIIQATDPFHDFEVPLVGVPDGFPMPSVRRKIKKTVTIKSPMTDTTQPWDLHVFSLPEMNSIDPTDTALFPYSYMVLGNDGLLQSRPDGAGHEIYFQMRIGPLVYVAVPQGQPTTPSTVAPVGSTTVSGLDLNNYFQGNVRLIASGFEIHNVTNELNVGGTITVYRLPQANVETTTTAHLARNTSDPTTTVFTPPIGTVISRMPPAFIEDALLLKGSRQWEAKYGCYCVDVYNMEHNQPQTSRYGSRVFAYGDTNGGDLGSTNNVWGLVGLPYAPGGAFPYAMYQPASKPLPRHTSGALLTGLPGPSQITLTAYWIEENFPGPDSPLVTLADVTPDYDPNFFILYKMIAEKMPVGVMVGENASGEFWSKILDVIGEVAPMVGSAFGPVGGLIGSGAGQLAKFGSSKIKAKPKTTAVETKVPSTSGKPSGSGFVKPAGKRK